MPTNPTGDSRTKTISLEPELYEATLRRWGKGTRFRTFSAYVAHLIRNDAFGVRYEEISASSIVKRDDHVSMAEEGSADPKPKSKPKKAAPG